ncbi:MAG: hypothetical protein M3122_03220 [Actinomycetota bacterium]|nr:hypothetical protein [Actinomycetota bacterium]
MLAIRPSPGPPDACGLGAEDTSLGKGSDDFLDGGESADLVKGGKEGPRHYLRRPG